ncbi:PAS domain-containing protein [Vibrio algarum]|uniref:PAS domain S-box protein n=1 Tax=Vibrio algarum TaxID=3020714 RepID=A0ABT4YMC0_9VIBR|nr:PAS domain S-box protein [Vibrio sp. KJ40-1]MDB1122697.1 PAS domain S-box protein [Vibrio sp. KJ40-1]
MLFFEIMRPASYWILIVLWLIIFAFYLKNYKQLKAFGGFTVVMFAILTIDAIRTLFESIYYGLYFTSEHGFIPIFIANTLSNPALWLLPKIVNIVAALLIIFCIQSRWVPERIQTIEKSDREKRLASNVYAYLSEGITITDTEGTIIDVNPAFTEITGFSRDEAIGNNPRILKSGRQSSEFYKGMWHALKTDGHWRGRSGIREKMGKFMRKY